MTTARRIITELVTGERQELPKPSEWETLLSPEEKAKITKALQRRQRRALSRHDNSR